MAVRTPKKGLIRDRKFRVLRRSKRQQTLDLVCNSCAHEFTVKDCPENFFFNCQNLACEQKSNLQDVLIVETELIPNKHENREFGITKNEREELISELLTSHPHPERE